jgi:1-acyl-sn-glycerol-3-phosphate acyltransferase
VNRVVALLALVLLLPCIAAAERIRHGAGRALAQRGIRVVIRFCGVSVVVRNGGALESSESLLLVPNHSSIVDIPSLLLACDRLRFVAAAELFRIPLLASTMRALNTFPLDRRDPTKARQQMAELGKSRTIGAGDRLVIFPEGHIRLRDQPLAFKSGAFFLAIESRTPIVPVAIHHSAAVVSPGGHLIVHPGTVVVEFLDTIETGDLGQADVHRLRDMAQERIANALAAESEKSQQWS